MNCNNATKINRKCGVAQWRDLLFPGRSTNADEVTPLPFVIPSVAEGSAFQPTFLGNVFLLFRPEIWELTRHRRLAHDQLRFHKSSLRCVVGRGR
jgi:hypothetical protein